MSAINFFVTLFLALISALGYLATKHPKLFKDRLFNPVYGAGMVVFVIAGAWIAAASVSFKAMLPFANQEMIDAAKVAHDNISDPALYVALACIALLVYMMILNWLAGHILDLDGPTKEGADQ